MTDAKPVRRARILLAPVLATLLLLGGMAVQAMLLPKAADAEPYHARVRAAIEGLPMQVGTWRGEDHEVTRAALALLKPNAIVNRQYTEEGTERRVGFLFEHCRDARDMAGHYPPICYPSHGWVAGATRTVTWPVRGGQVAGMEYEFTRVLPDRSVGAVVANVFVLPNGRIVPEMADIRRAAADYRTHFYGAAQIQMTFDVTVPTEQRRQIVATFLEASLPAIEAVLRGVK